MQANQQLFLHCIHYTHYLFISLFVLHPCTEGPKRVHYGGTIFYIPNHIWEQLNQGKEVEISVPSQPTSSDSSEQKASGSTKTYTTGIEYI